MYCEIEQAFPSSIRRQCSPSPPPPLIPVKWCEHDDDDDDIELEWTWNIWTTLSPQKMFFVLVALTLLNVFLTLTVLLREHNAK